MVFVNSKFMVKTKMKILFIGASGFGLRCLNSLISNSLVNVVGVITAKKDFEISYSKESVTNILHDDLDQLASDNNIPCFIMKTNMKDEKLISFANSLEPDFIVVVGWYHMITSNYFEIAPCYGLHASLLPKYCGGAPLVWTLINGERKAGISLFQLDSGVDSGDIVGQEEVLVSENETIKTLYQKIELKGLDLIEKFVRDASLNQLKLKPQDHSKRTVYPQRSPKDGLIDWSWTSTAIDRFIRAQTKPYPGAFTIYNNQKYVIYKSEIVSIDHNSVPGDYYENNGSYYFRALDSWIKLTDFKIIPRVL